jgi:hypothetical protein
MNTGLALKKRDAAVRQVRDLFSTALVCGMDNSTLTIRWVNIQSTTLAKCPQWAKSFVDGYWRCMIDQAYRNDLIFGGWYLAPGSTGKAAFYSTHSNRPDYYAKHGIEPSAYADDGAVFGRGHYWKRSVDEGKPRVFFTADLRYVQS